MQLRQSICESARGSCNWQGISSDSVAAATAPPKRLTNPENVSVRMPHVHFAHSPRMIGRWPHHFQALCRAIPILGVDIVNPYGDPDAFVGGPIAFRPERCGVVAF